MTNPSISSGEVPEEISDPKLLLNFDLYTRNHYISNFINSIEKKNLKVLDVGGRNGRLKDFLNTDIELVVLDIRETEGQEENFILASILENKLKSESFDVVTSSDFYEHIEKKERLQVIDEMLRLSKDIVIIAAPFFSPEVSKAEKSVNAFYKRIHNVEHPWLAEHFEAELPETKLIEDILREKKLHFYSFGTNNVTMWELMQLSIFFLSQRSINQKNIEHLQFFYNTNLENLLDKQEPTYRKIYIMSKKGKIYFEPAKRIGRQDPSLAISLLSEKIFETLTVVMEDKNQHIANLVELNDSKDKLLLAKDVEIRKLHENLRSLLQSRSWRLLSKLKAIKNKASLR